MHRDYWIMVHARDKDKGDMGIEIGTMLNMLLSFRKYSQYAQDYIFDGVRFAFQVMSSQTIEGIAEIEQPSAPPTWE
jgi:hypothetical protein